MKKRVIIIGGGYAGLKAVQTLAATKEFEITLIDKHPYHYMQTEVYDFIANESDFSKITVDLFTYCHGFKGNVNFIKEEVLDIDAKNHKVSTANRRLSFDYLVVSVGSRTRYVKNLKGLQEFSYGVKSLNPALYFKQKFEYSLFKKVEDEGTKCTPISIVITGAGLSGVEIAAQMASFAKDFYDKNHFLCRKLNIELINSHSHILKGVDDILVKKTTQKLENLGVVTHNNTKVTAVDATHVTLDSGKTIPVDFMIYTGGIEPNSLIQKVDLAKDERGFLATNRYLQVKECENIFAVGDATSIQSRAGDILAPTADVAEQAGVHAAKNIIYLANNRALKTHRIRARGILIAIGRHYSVGKLQGVYIKGRMAYFMKKMVERFYAFMLSRRSKKGHNKIFK